jgi:predicted RND superfamily exporter protein
MFGIGVDDALIISGSYRRTDPSKEPADCMDKTIEDIGLSIGLTTLTLALAFALGCISSIPGIYWLCLYAFPTVTIIFFYQTSFFVALTVIDEHRVQASRYDCLVCYTSSTNADFGGTATNANKDKHSDPTNDSNSEDGQDQHQNQGTPTTEELANSECVPPLSANKQSFPTDSIMNWYAKKLLQPWVKFIVIASFIALLAGCAYSTTKLQQQVNFRDLLPEDSYIHTFFDGRDSYSTNAGNINTGFIYFRDVDQSDPLVQRQMEDYVNALVEAEAIVRQPTYFWLHHFHMFINQLNNSTLTQQWVANATFSEQLDAFLEVPIFGTLYHENIVRDPETGEITASRCFMEINVDLGDSRASINKLAIF